MISLSLFIYIYIYIYIYIEREREREYDNSCNNSSSGLAQKELVVIILSHVVHNIKRSLETPNVALDPQIAIMVDPNFM
jgi:hypothetical protein